MTQPEPDRSAVALPLTGIARLLQYRNALLLLVALALLALLSKSLYVFFHEVRYDELVAAVRATPSTTLALAVLAMFVSYFTLTGYDLSGLRYAGVKLPYRIVAPTAFIAYALGNTVGLGVLTGGAVRFRLYAAAGVEPGAISRAIAFNALAFGLGIGVVGAVALLWNAGRVADTLHLPSATLVLFATVMLAATALLLWRCATRPELSLPGGRHLRLPSPGLASQQLAISAADIAASAAVLWLLLPAGTIPFPAFAAFYAIAIAAGVISHIPGGLGVFEAIMLLALGGRLPPEQLAGALVLYRVIYHVLPLALALLMLAGHELRRTATPIARAATELSPLLLSAFALVAGLMLLASGVTPATDYATALLAMHVPLWLVEAAHFLGSVAGLALLIVARGMLLRLDAAWWAGWIVALFSLVLALPKGVALYEALVLLLLVATLLVSRHHFTRKAALLSQAFSLSWFLAIAAVFGALTALLFFAYRDIDYTHQLWWQFTFDGHAPRSLRALVATALLALALALRRLLRPAMLREQLPAAAELERTEVIVQNQPCADARLALLGDKHLMFSESGRSFVMYGRQGRSWIGLYDPVGDADEQPELVWRLIERAAEAGGRASFYEVRPQNLPQYLDAGLRVYKLGEYASVPLRDFSLKGSQRSGLRQTLSRGERDGLRFEVVPAAGVDALLPDLRRISDAWLQNHRTAEKRFSLGCFNEAYIRRQPVAVIRREGAAVAFATLMTTGLKAEASVDLMRQLPEAPRSAMEFLFVNLILHLQAEGHGRFGLGMAPLSGMAEHPLAPNWHRFARLLFAHGESFYNFQGLRAFKEKFDPEWEPRYLASPGGVAPLLVLTDVARLISGGFKGVISK